ncbi:hypothetical protein P170DRAFT_431491 [Aspergillus steynii IBT 23096]|uniref:Myb-like domain-containing protein n=1 Tax=Aspergillus steynii IBT 23096 TaxID=1392250 RepID=A0A2I2GLA5_9EURO|nr:uncharacterized protein P170DRAFT_431491 [Aspergillus steynii IBT 23096]PLB53662.1 hypothetical protein P170DRAFT_431491 [Aspergillus steynii IBT 23096]
MLLPSALPCDTRRPSTRSRLTPSRLFTTPPPSDDDFPSNNGLVGTCRALQSLLSGSPAPSPRRSKTPRLQSPLQIQPRSSARSRKQKQNETSSIPSPKPQRPRDVNKRRRDSYELDFEEEDAGSADAQTPSRNARFSTPKRRRYVPYDLPLGLSQSDFYSLRTPPVTQSPPSPAQRRKHELDSKQGNCASPFNPDAALPSIEETQEPAVSDTESWTSDDDQRLVELVLEKFQLSKRDWDDCARRMGKDNASVGRRWQALLGDGDVGLRRGRRMVRGRLHENWM